jgi:hypothetical protein
MNAPEILAGYAARKSRIFSGDSGPCISAISVNQLVQAGALLGDDSVQTLQ